MRIVEEEVLPRGLYFARIPGLQTDTELIEIDGMDLTLTALPPYSKDREIGSGFTYRIRCRFISSRPLTEEEKAEVAKWRETLRQFIERTVPPEPPPPALFPIPGTCRTGQGDVAPRGI